MRESRVLVFGDLNIDVLIYTDYFEFKDVSYPIEKMTIAHGGVAGNIATGLRRLGMETTILGSVGDDALGKELLEALKKENIDLSGIRVMKKSPTGTMVIFVFPDGKRTIIGHRGANIHNTVSEKEAIRFLTGKKHLHVSGFTIYNLDEGKSIVTLARTAKNMGVSTSIDLEGIAYKKREFIANLRGLYDYAFLNEDELEQLTNKKDFYEALKEVWEKMHPKLIFLKRGKKGAIVYDGNDYFEGKPYIIKPVDSTGAGDAFNSGVIYGLVKGYSLEYVLKLGNMMGAYNCTMEGARVFPRNLDELLSFFGESLG